MQINEQRFLRISVSSSHFVDHQGYQRIKIHPKLSPAQSDYSAVHTECLNHRSQYPKAMKNNDLTDQHATIEAIRIHKDIEINPYILHSDCFCLKLLVFV